MIEISEAKTDKILLTVNKRVNMFCVRIGEWMMDVLNKYNTVGDTCKIFNYTILSLKISSES